MLIEKDRESIERLITEFGRDIYSFCVYLTGNRDEADDLYQQTFLVAIEKGELDFDKNAKSYLLSIAVNLRNNSRRKQLWRRNKFELVSIDDAEITETVGDGRENAEDTILRKERDLQVRKAIAELPEKMRQVIVLFYTEEMQVAQIAEILKINEGTVKSRLHYAKDKIRRRLDHYEQQ